MFDTWSGEGYLSPGLFEYGGRPATTLHDGSPHGTAVAAAALGITLGVAKGAQMVGVKFIANVTAFRPDDLIRAWNWAVADVRAKGRGGRAIINLSYSKP